MTESPLHPNWERTFDRHGHKPKFEIKCRFCGGDMIVRYSKVFSDRDPLYGVSGPTHQIAMKCPACAWVCRFNVRDDPEYLEVVINAREGKSLYVPPSEDWLDSDSDDEKIARQLAALGYIGGRTDV